MDLTLQTTAILVAAGLLGGMANAMAGGASLVTFPAMLAVGLAPIPANASNALAVVFGNITGAWTERHKLPHFTPALWTSCASAVAGGALGGILLLVTPESLFVMMVPALIGVATAIFAFSTHIQKWVKARFGSASDGLQAGLVLPAAAYGGYFGAGLGVIFMAVLSSTSSWELRSTNAVKNVFGVLANAAAIVIFVAEGLIAWPQTLVMLLACIVGAYLGVKALRVIPAAAMKRAVVLIGLAMTAYYAWRFWL